jgi:hypothetical protein
LIDTSRLAARRQRCKNNCILLISFGAILLWCRFSFANEIGCAFQPKKFEFVGTAAEQALCLLRPVGRAGKFGQSFGTLPSPLSEIVGHPVTITKERFRTFIAHNSIQETVLGGSLDNPISRGNGNDPDRQEAVYFVIHDTSYPNFLGQPFPNDIDTDSWEPNHLDHYKPVAHVFISRTGASKTFHDFATPFRATKFEVQELGKPGKGMFLHVENVQPRRSSPGAPSGNDISAPSPGLTTPQLNRLALVYVAASIRRGEWLIPAYHAVIDMEEPNGHDDPQNFDLFLWAAQLGSILDSLSERSP